MQPIYLICGVSGSGKSWVCRQLAEKFHYIPHDEYYDLHPEMILEEARKSKKPLITESPFGERLLKERLEAEGMTVHPYFVIEKPEVVQKRYLEREKKELPKNALTRATTIVQRADEWKAPRGTSEQILTMLKEFRF